MERRSKRTATRASGDSVWIAVTSDMAALLRAEFARTGLGFANMLDGAKGRPARLTARIVRGWLYREADTADDNHWRYVIERLAKTPDMIGAPPFHEKAPRKVFSNYPDHRPLTDEECSLLKHHRNRTGVGGSVLLRDASDKPQGLTPQMISSWMSEKPPRANPDHVRYVLDSYARRPAIADAIEGTP